MKPEAVIFDMDGVLVNSEELWRKLDGNFLTHFPDLAEEKKQVIRKKLSGRSMRAIYDLLAEEAGLVVPFEEFYTARIALCLDKVYPNTVLNPGVLTFLEYVSAQVPTGLGSSSPRVFVDAVFRHHPIGRHFREVVCIEDACGISKPAPDIFLLAASRLCVAPEKCLVIEDSMNGVLAAKNAGMTVWGYKNGINIEQDLSAADMVFHDFSELTL